MSVCVPHYFVLLLLADVLRQRVAAYNGIRHFQNTLCTTLCGPQQGGPDWVLSDWTQWVFSKKTHVEKTRRFLFFFGFFHNYSYNFIYWTHSIILVYLRIIWQAHYKKSTRGIAHEEKKSGIIRVPGLSHCSISDRSIGYWLHTWVRRRANRLLHGRRKTAHPNKLHTFESEGLHKISCVSKLFKIILRNKWRCYMPSNNFLEIIWVYTQHLVQLWKPFCIVKIRTLNKHEAIILPFPVSGTIHISGFVSSLVKSTTIVTTHYKYASPDAGDAL